MDQNQNQRQSLIRQNQRRSRLTGFTSGFVDQTKQTGITGFLKKVDMFSFLPVPIDQPVSTKRSLIGTALVLLIFTTYVIFDFVSFLIHNPGISQTYYTKFNGQQYELPRFAVTFMYNYSLEVSDPWNEYLSFKLTKQIKNPGYNQSQNLDLKLYQFNQNQSAEKQNIQYLDWLDFKTQNFYKVLRSPSTSTFAKGLLYSTANASYTKVKISLCDYVRNVSFCRSKKQIDELLAGGRLFLFVQNKQFDTSVDLTDEEDQLKFFIYTFFLMPEYYKRATINYEIQKLTVEPDYFWRWWNYQYQRLKVNHIVQDISDIRANAEYQNQTQLDTFTINFQLHNQVLNTKVTYTTLIDRIAMWGALWGVLFALFAFYFLSYNRKKYYRKNPEWSNFKKTLEQNIESPIIITAN